MTATFSNLGARVTLLAALGSDLAIPVTVTVNGAAFPWAGVTVTTQIVNINNASTPAPVATLTFTPGVSGAAVVSLTKAQLDTLGDGSTYLYSIVANAGNVLQWSLGGQMSVKAAFRPNQSATAGIAVTVTAGTIAVTLTTAVSPSILAADAAFTGRYVPQTFSPAVETTTNNLFKVTPPTTAPWEQIEFGSGPQANGTYDHVMVMGWNASVFPDNGVNSVANQSAIFMGFEDGWYDGTRNGAEWYVGYYSPDRSVQLFRPFYTRILNDLKGTTIAAGSNGVNTSTFAGAGVLNVASTTGYPTSGKVYVVTAGTPATVTFTGKTATTFTGCTTTAGGGVMATGGAVTGYTWSAGSFCDIGTDGTGAFSVIAGPTATLFSIVPSLMTFRAAVGTATMIVDGATTAGVQFKVNGAASFQWYTASADQLQLLDKNARGQITFTQGASAAAAMADFISSVKVQGRLSVTTGAAMATNATDGFFAINSCAGTPTGSPVIIAGSVPMIYDVTNNFLYAYNGGWKKTTVFA